MSGPSVQENGTNYPNGILNRNRSGSVSNYQSKVTVVLGAQWGDEGKGKVVDMLATGVDVVCRCQVQDFLIVWRSFCNIVIKSAKKNYKDFTVSRYHRPCDL